MEQEINGIQKLRRKIIKAVKAEQDVGVKKPQLKHGSSSK